MPKKKKKSNIELLLEQNNRIENKIDKLRKDFKKAQAVNFFRFIMVAVPILLAILYLIPLVREFIDIYRPIVDFMNSAASFY